MSETPQDIRVRLPASAYDLGIRLGAHPQRAPASVRLTQRGRIKTKLDARSWMGFTANQTISVHVCDFDWRAKAGPFGVIRVRDALVNGEARLGVSAWGAIPLARAKNSAALIRGELMRYLAELAWAPDAILHNGALHWRDDGPDRMTVSAGSGVGRAEVMFDLDNDGRIAGAYAPDRPRSPKAPFLPTPWQGRFSEYRQHDGLWLPFAGQVAWLIDGVERVYFEGRLESWARRP